MPGGDRKGPMGKGPMTGRGSGLCAGNDTPDSTTDINEGRGMGRGRGRGKGRGFGHGQNWGFRFRMNRRSAEQIAESPDQDRSKKINKNKKK